VADEDCLICQKHRGRGPLVGPVVYQDDVLVVTHRAAGSLGYLFVETRRHVGSLALLTDAEAAAVGWVGARLARGLCSELEAEHVHTMVAGLGVPHFHQHVFVRHRGTPSSLGWCEPWPEAPQGDPAGLARRLAGYL
jgi:diadenosine tetraphosphate (Ap4A) HIT family hydrolase